MSDSGIFKAAVKLSPERRAAYLDQACGSNHALRCEVESLLQAHDEPGSFLQSRLARQTATVDEPPLTAKPGTLIGSYKLLQQIGEGGMGVVYMAEQLEPVRRKVALKIITPGMDSRQVIARFEAERQALAMMDHQNIARVLDAGTTESGQPYFVMELVHGVPITRFCDDNKLTPRERLALFVPVCQAIQHAHQKGIIHRDIKPSNVLVTMYDDKPVPKVINFGVAKAIEQRLTEKTMFTHYGALVGTFEYMSPEQAEMNAFGVDTRSDVYSLGVRIWDSATGKELLALKGHADRVSSVAFSPDGQRLASANQDGSIHLWETTSVSREMQHRRATQQMVADIFGQMHLRADVLERLRTLPGMSPSRRQEAIAVAQMYPDNPNELNELAWQLVKLPGGERKQRPSFSSCGSG